MTDVTGFGLAGHLLEICRGSKLAAEVRWDALPLIASAVGHAQNGIWTGASTRNWASYGASVTLPDGFPDWQRALVTDPQTSGGLLVSVSADGVDAVLAMFREAGFGEAAVVVTDVSAGEAVIPVMGPRSRELLARVSPDDFSNAGHPFGTAREIEIGLGLARAHRVSYVGELGWELYAPMEQGRDRKSVV